MTSTVHSSRLSVVERKDLTVTDALLPANIFKPCGLKQYLNIRVFQCNGMQRSC
jgi:hypothetical protein